MATDTISYEVKAQHLADTLHEARLTLLLMNEYAAAIAQNAETDHILTDQDKRTIKAMYLLCEVQNFRMATRRIFPWPDSRDSVRYAVTEYGEAMDLLIRLSRPGDLRRVGTRPNEDFALEMGQTVFMLLSAIHSHEFWQFWQHQDGEDWGNVLCWRNDPMHFFGLQIMHALAAVESAMADERHFFAATLKVLDAVCAADLVERFDLVPDTLRAMETLFDKRIADSDRMHLQGLEPAVIRAQSLGWIEYFAPNGENENGKRSIKELS